MKHHECASGVLVDSRRRVAPLPTKEGSVPLTTDPVFPVPALTVEPWPDPVVDELGHDPRSAYVERFWLPVLGPSTVWFLRRVADRLDDEPDGFTLDLADTARSLGVGMRGGRNSPMVKTIERTCRFGAARMHGAGELAVRRRLAPLNRAQAERLPESLQREHTAWLQRPRPTPDVEQRKDRARALALSMLELGEDPDACERQLHRWRFHPALAHEAIRWAVANHTADQATGDPDPAATGEAPTRLPTPPMRPPLPRPRRPGLDAAG